MQSDEEREKEIIKMKRPLFLCFAGLVLGEAAAIVTGEKGGILVALGLFPMVALSVGKRGWSRFFLLFWCCMAAGYGRGQNVFGQNLPLDGTSLPRTAVVSGRISHLSEGKQKLSVTLEKVEVALEDGQTEKLRGNCRMYVETEEGLAPGDWVQARGELAALKVPTNPGEFRQDVYEQSGGISCHFFARSLAVFERESFFLPRLSYFFRKKMGEVYVRVMDENTSALLSAVVLGDKSMLSEEEKERYGDNGVAHLLAVSGLHVSIVAGSWFRFCRRQKVSYGAACLSGASLLFVYGLMTGFGSSVLRASIMYAVYLGAEYTGRQYDMLSAMSLAGIWMLLESPWRMMEGGFQISFVLVAVIGGVLPLVSRLEEGRSKKMEGEWIPFEALRKKGKDAIFSSTVIMVTTLPVVLRIFFEFSPYSIVLNTFFIPMMVPVMISGLLCGLAGMFWLPAGYVAGSPASLILKLFHVVLDAVGKLPGAPFVTGCPSLLWCLWYYGICLMIFIFRYDKKRRKAAVLAVGGLLAIRCFSPPTCLAMTMLDVGQGECILIRTPDRRSIMIDGGSTSEKEAGRYVIVPALRYFGMAKLDALILTHADEDHINGVEELLKSGIFVRRLLLPQGREEEFLQIKDMARKKGTEIIGVSRGQRFSFSKAVTMQCLHPDEGEMGKDKNEASLVFHLQYGGFDALFTGDLEREGEEMFCSFLQREGAPFSGSLEVLKVAHHGSRFSTSEALLSVLSPEIGLISVGERNRYGHPHKELLDRMKAHQVEIWRTDERGAISIKSDGRTWEAASFVLPFPARAR